MAKARTVGRANCLPPESNIKVKDAEINAPQSPEAGTGFPQSPEGRTSVSPFPEEGTRTP